MASASDVPSKYDLVINGQGYLLLDALTPNIPFRSHRAIYTYSPTFLERLNVQGSYGDNQQAFWLTSSQDDWSLGEGQHFFRGNDDQSRRKFWRGENIDIDTLGQATLFTSTVVAASPPATAVGPATSGMEQSGDALYISATNLYHGQSATDLGAHGATIATLSNAAIATDGRNVYISGDSGTIRKWNNVAFSDFSTQIAYDLCFVDNTLWGVNNSTLYYYSTSGTATSAFTWKTADGVDVKRGGGMRIKPFGGQVMVLRPGGRVSPAELWTADAGGASQVAAFPENFIPDDMAVVNGIVFVVGYSRRIDLGYRCEVWYYANGNIGRAYASELYQGSVVKQTIHEYKNGFAFLDGANKQILSYNLSTGAISTIMSSDHFPNPYGDRVWFALDNSGTNLLFTASVTTVTTIGPAFCASTGKLISSQHDFDSSLVKLFRGITVDWNAASDGDGGSVDILYKIDGTDIGPLDLTYTSLQTSAVSGTEYVLNNETGHTISVQVTLNKGTSTNGPTVKRVYVRAVPLLQTFKKREYIVDLTGAPPDEPRLLRDKTPYATIPFDGITNLVSAATSATPFTITDRLGTFTGIIEPDGFEVYEMHAQQEVPSKSGSYVVKVTVREV